MGVILQYFSYWSVKISFTMDFRISSLFGSLKAWCQISHSWFWVICLMAVLIHSVTQACPQQWISWSF